MIATFGEWLGQTRQYAADLRRSARSIVWSSSERATFAQDAEYVSELIGGTVLWLQLAMPASGVVVDGGTEEERALKRLGLRASEAKAKAILKRHYLRVLEACAWKLVTAARLLGIGERTMQRFVASARR
ncbi:MAG TPA: hypothetical protein VFF06_33285 [Polyangia bacterium]|nr:hypothetical protein [Polyangia bacterium]